MKKIKAVAFYLPQFHAIPENDRWWGEGFTEWTNVKKAIPLWNGHYQPKVPMDKNYYNLLNIDVMISQAKMAKKYGLHGFCYYHYWFGKGKKLLERPIEMMLNNPLVDIPFCFSWANENWSRNWDGGNREIMVEQDYGDEESWELHLNYLAKFFSDPRYIRIDNKPVFIIYKPELIKRFNEMISYFRKNVKRYGIKDLIVCSQYPNVFRIDKTHYDLDYKIKFEPMYTNCHYQDKNIISRKITALKLGVKRIDGLTVRNYDKQWKYILNAEKKGENLIPGAFVDWDNTARNKKGTVFVGATPKKFKHYFHELIEQVKNDEFPTEFVFINAWNEWGEGAYLEPDEKHGYAYLEAMVDVLNNKI